MEHEPQPVVLTERQGRVLWLMSMGYTREGIARETGWPLSSVKGLCLRARLALGAATDAQAVRIGLLDGHIGPYADCGSLAAYRRHIKRDEATCPACKHGNRERTEAEAMLSVRTPQLAEPHIRLLRAMHAGRTNFQIRHAWNIDERTLTRLISTTYALLGVHEMPRHVRREAALREATARGLLRTTPPDITPGSAAARVALTKTQVKVLRELDRGLSLAEAAAELDMHPGTVATRLSEVYRRLDVAWMDKQRRRPEALRKARALGLLPEPATT